MPLWPSLPRHHVLGVLALAFYATHAGFHASRGHPEEMFWSCHLGTALVGVGFLVPSPLANAIGFLWLVVGNVLWDIDLAGGANFFPTSVLTHVGGLLLSLYGLREYGMPRQVWWKAVAALLALQQLTRWTTPPATNVNLAFSVWNGWEAVFPSYFWYSAMLAAIALVAFLALERIAGRLAGFTAAAPAASASGAPAGRRRS